MPNQNATILGKRQYGVTKKAIVIENSNLKRSKLAKT